MTSRRHASAFLLRRHRCLAMALYATLACTGFAMTITETRAQEGSSTVSLPMYEVSDAVKKADDVFWSHLQQKLKSDGINAPVALARTNGELVDQWEQRDLLLSQACGYPYVHTLADKGIKMVGTPVYATNSSLPAGEYRSVIVVKADSPYKTLADLKGKKAGVNEWNSNSGMNLFRATVASSFPSEALKQGIFSSVTLTEGHLKSVRMIAAGQIDLASIDDVSYDLIRRDYPELAAKTRILTVTPAAPGLPLITSAQTDDATIQKMRTAIKGLIEHPDDAALRQALATMKLTGFVVIDKQDYVKRIRHLEDMARDKGYPTLK
ncbi:phosphate/phosphite/phosphonate ABC transporter substrate-binding protein [Dyella koreensis]|uniref:PhnD/SsuA/transferrin family substrate-binding protein n=1 Tax=Dyella koreensis TaxID=311235 RepID=A0ABW8K7M4_9GAMM